MVKAFSGRIYLTMRKEMSVIEEIEDIVDVAEVDGNDFAEYSMLKNTTIVPLYLCLSLYAKRFVVVVVK